MKRITILAFLLTVCFVTWVSAMEVLDTAKAKSAVSDTRYLTLQSAFEGPIDPNVYIIGPGDEMYMFIIGVLETALPIYINPEGYANVPTVGEFAVSGKTLAEASKIIREQAEKRYAKGIVSVRLSKPRMFRVTLAGSVYMPGRYIVSAVSRTSDLLEMAGGPRFSEEPKDTTPDGRPIITPPRAAPLRGLWLIHRSGDTTLVDIELFYQCGELKGNPFLQDGDILVVPYWSSRKGVVRLFGAVQQPMVARFVAGDRLRTMIRLSGGIVSNAQGKIELSRIDSSGNRQTQIFNRNWINSDDLGPLILPDDQIFVPYETDQKLRSTVSIQGEVFFPGDYPVDEKTVTLKDVLMTAGGPTSRANLDEIQVIRRSLLSIPDPEFNRLYGLKKDEMSWSEYEYMKAKRRDLEPRVAVNYKVISGRDSILGGNFILWDGDIIRLPKKQVTIKVLGQVINPGLIAYTPKKSYRFYIDEAGGYTTKAKTSQIRIIKAQSGQWLKASTSTIIEPGDTIFIPETADTDWWVSYKDMMLILSQIATLALAYYTVTK